MDTCNVGSKLHVIKYVKDHGNRIAKRHSLSVKFKFIFQATTRLTLIQSGTCDGSLSLQILLQGIT